MSDSPPTRRDALVVNDRIRIPHDELDFSFVRSSGPGGQNVNKVNSKAVLRWAAATSPSVPPDVLGRFLTHYRSRLTNEGELILTSQRHRDQGRNVADCLDKLRAMLIVVAAPPRRRRKTKPSRAAVEKRLQSKRRVSEKKERRRGPSVDS